MQLVGWLVYGTQGTARFETVWHQGAVENNSTEGSENDWRLEKIV